MPQGEREIDGVYVGDLLSWVMGRAQSDNAWVTIMSNMMLQSSGKALSASVLSLARQGIFLIPILLISSSIFGLFGIQTAQPIADFCSFLLSIPLIISFFKELDKNKI